MVITQGDSYPLSFNLNQDGDVLSEDLVEDLEITIGGKFRKVYSKGEVSYDAEQKQWRIWPTQEETFAMLPGPHRVVARAKYPGKPWSELYSFEVGCIHVKRANRREVL